MKSHSARQWFLFFLNMWYIGVRDTMKTWVFKSKYVIYSTRKQCSEIVFPFERSRGLDLETGFLTSQISTQIEVTGDQNCVWAIPWHLTQRSPAQNWGFANTFSEERQTCIVIKAKILDEYLLVIFTWDSELESHLGGNNNLIKMAGS